MMPVKKELSLLPESDNYNSIQGRVVRWLTTVGRVVIIFTELIVVAAFLSRFWLDRKNADISEILRQQKAILTSTKDFENEFNLLQARLKYIKDFNASDPRIVPRLTSLAQSVPKEVVVDTISITKADDPITQVSLSANAPQQENVVDFITNLTLNPRVKSLEISRIEKKPKNNKFLMNLNIQLIGLKEDAAL